MADMILVGQFTAAKVGVNGLTVTIDVEQIEIATGTRTALVTGASATAVGRRGLYTYRLAGANPSLYVHIATFITASTSVDQQEVAAVAMVVPDELVSSRLAPTVAGRTLDVSAGGEAGVDWANVGSPATAQNLSGTTVDLVANAVDAAAVAADAVTEIQNGLATAAALALIAAALADLDGRIPVALSDDGLMESNISRILGSGAAAGNLRGILDGTGEGQLAIKRVIILSEVNGEPAVLIATSADDTPAVSVQALGDNSHAVLVDGGSGGSDIHLGNAAANIQAAIWANATRTLTSFGTLVADIWTYATRTLTSGGGATVEEIIDGILAILTADVTDTGTFFKFIKDKLALITTSTSINVDSPVNAGMLTITKAVSLDSGPLDVTVPAGWTKCYVTGKKDKDDPDTAALFQLVESNPGAGGDGLLYLNGAAAQAANLGNLIVDEDNNQVQFTLTDNATAQIKKLQTGFWDIKFLKSDGSSTRPVAGLLQVVLPATLTI